MAARMNCQCYFTEGGPYVDKTGYRYNIIAPKLSNIFK